MTSEKEITIDIIPNDATDNETATNNQQMENNDRMILSSASSVMKLYQNKKLKPMTDVKEKMIAGTFLCVILLIFLFALLNEPKYKFIAAQMFTVFLFFYVGYICHLLKAKYLHRMKIVTTCIEPDFGWIVFPLQLKPYPTKPIMSMSEMFALRGSQIHHMFTFMCSMMGGIVSTAIYSHSSNLYKYGNIDTFWDKQYIELFLSMSSTIATPLIGAFDLNPNDKIHQIFHYSGVLCMMISVFPYALQSGFNVLSIILIIGSFGSWIIWFCISYYYPRDVKDKFGNTKEDEMKMKEYVHSISIKCILAETIGCIFASMCNVAYVWNLRDVTTC